MSKLMSKIDQAFLGWEIKNYRWNHRAIGAHPHDTLMMIHSSSHGIRQKVASMERQFREALEFDSPLALNRLAHTSFDCNLIFVPQIAHMIMQGDEEVHPRLFAALDAMLPQLKHQIDTMTSKEEGELTWTSDNHLTWLCEYIASTESIYGSHADDHKKQAVNGIAFLLHKHGFYKAERPNFPFVELPYWLPDNLKQRAIVETLKPGHGA